MLKINSVEEHIKEIKTKKVYNRDRSDGFLGLPFSIRRAVLNGDTSSLEKKIEKQKVLDPTILDDFISIYAEGKSNLGGPHFYKLDPKSDTRYLGIGGFSKLDEIPDDSSFIPYSIENIFTNLSVLLSYTGVGLKHEDIKKRLKRKLYFDVKALGIDVLRSQLSSLKDKGFLNYCSSGAKKPTNYWSITDDGKDITKRFLFEYLKPRIKTDLSYFSETSLRRLIAIENFLISTPKSYTTLLTNSQKMHL